MDTVWRCRRFYARSALLRAGPAGGKEGALFCVLTARLKPCPDTCMVDGYSVAVQAGMRNVGIVKEKIRKSEIGGLCAPLRCARALRAARKGRYLRLYGTAKAVP